MGRRVDTDRAALSIRAARPGWLAIALAVVPVGVLGIFYLWPLVTLLGRVLDGDAFRRTIGRSGLGEVVWFTCWQAAASTIATLVVGLPIAHLLSRWTFPGRRALSAIVTVPFMLPTVVVGAAFVALLPDRMIGTALAIVLAHVFFNIAVVARVVGALWERIPRDLAAAAATLGAPRWRVTKEITLPLLRPAIVAAASVTFLFTFTSYGVVRVLGGPDTTTIEVEIVRRATQLGDVSGAAVLALLQLAVLALMIGWTMMLQRRSTSLSSTGTVTRARPATTSQRWAIVAGALATAALMLAPLLALVAASVRIGGQWTTTAWTTLGESEIRPGLQLGVDPVGAISASLQAAVVATALSVLVGLLAALAIDSAGRSGGALDLGVMLPLGTSAVTIGLGMLITFDQDPFDWRAEPWLVPIGHALVAIPFVVRTLLPVLRARPAGWLEAAATLGASPLRAWWHVDVRVLARPIVIAAGLAAAISLGEFGATTFLSRTGRETLPIAIDRLLSRAGDIPRAQGFALATILMVMTVALVLAVDAIGSERGHGARRS